MNFRTITKWVRDWFLGDPQVKPVTQIDDSLKQMGAALDSEADATSFLMALADTKHDELAKALADVNNWEAQAAQMLNGPNPDEGAARRCIFLKQQAADRVAALTTEYQQLQAQAETRAETYAANLNVFETTREAAGTIRQQAEFHKKRADILKVTRQGAGFQDAAATFAAAQQAVQLEGSQLANRELLTANPNAAIDRTIRERVVGGRIDAELALLKQKAQSGQPALPAPDSSSDTVLELARAALQKPRFQAALIERQIGNSTKKP